MKITIESTERIVKWRGVECRIWNGVTEDGTDCLVSVPVIRVVKEAAGAAFEGELRDLHDGPTAFPIRHLI